MSKQIRAIAAAIALLVAGGLTACSAGLATFRLHDWAGASAATALSSLQQVSKNLAITTQDGSEPPSDLTGWVVVSESPAPGTSVTSSQTIHLVLAPAPLTATPSPTARTTPTSTPTATPSPVPSTPSAPAPPAAPAQPAAPAAPAQPAAPAPPPAPAPATEPIIPGAFCSDSQVGQVAQAANGKSYRCGGKGADASGHYHWNTM